MYAAVTRGMGVQFSSLAPCVGYDNREYDTMKDKNVSTGIKAISDALMGGNPTGQLTVVMASRNTGKSRIMENRTEYTIRNWHHESACSEKLANLGYQHDFKISLTHDELVKLVGEFLKTMNVQVYKREGYAYIGVTDKYGFNQRG